MSIFLKKEEKKKRNGETYLGILLVTLIWSNIRPNEPELLTIKNDR